MLSPVPRNRFQNHPQGLVCEASFHSTICYIADAVAKRYRPWPKGLRTDSLPWFDSPLVQGASRLRYTDKAQVAATGPYWPKGARNKKSTVLSVMETLFALRTFDEEVAVTVLCTNATSLVEHLLEFLAEWILTFLELARELSRLETRSCFFSTKEPLTQAIWQDIYLEATFYRVESQVAHLRLHLDDPKPGSTCDSCQPRHSVQEERFKIRRFEATAKLKLCSADPL